MAAFVLGRVQLDAAAHQANSALRFQLEGFLHGVAPDSLQGPALLVASQTLVPQSDVGVVLSFHGVLRGGERTVDGLRTSCAERSMIIRKRFSSFVPRKGRKDQKRSGTKEFIPEKNGRL